MFQAQGVYLDNKIYIGGGNTGYSNTDSLVSEYNLKTKSWSTLAPTIATYFGLCKLDGEIICVGGKVDQEVISSVFNFDSFTKRWKRSLPSLITDRYFPSCISTESAIIVFGGLTEGGELLSSIEVMKSDSYEWFTTGYLPRSAILCHSTPVVINDSIYLLGGYKSITANSFSNSVYSCPIDVLLNTCGIIPNTWSPLPSTPHYQSTTTKIGPCLIALGGTDSAFSPPVYESIYGYSPSMEAWNFIGELPYAFCHGTAVSLPNDDIFIMGGWIEQGKHKGSHNVYHGVWNK